MLQFRFIDLRRTKFFSSSSLQHVQDPTRGKNILDLVFTFEENMIENLVVGENFGTSDHQIIRWNMLACKKLQRDNKNYNCAKVNYDIMRHEIV